MTSRMSVSSAASAVSCRGIASSSSRERHGERQDQPVRLRKGQGAFGGLVRRVLVADLTIGEPGQQISLDDPGVTDDLRNGSRATKDTLQVAETLGQSALREAGHRAGITDFAGARPVAVEALEWRPGLADPAQRESAYLPSACRAAIQLSVDLCEAIG
jgi:hypothetical protein